MHRLVHIVAYMPLVLAGSRFFTTAEAAKYVGVHRLTLLRWIREGRFSDVPRNRNGWRVFDQKALDDLYAFAHSVEGRASANQRVLFSAKAASN